MGGERVKVAQRELYEAGEYSALSAVLEPAAAALVEAASVSEGEAVLDVAAGDGECRSQGCAARARVVATDLSPVQADCRDRRTNEHDPGDRHARLGRQYTRHVRWYDRDRVRPWRDRGGRDRHGHDHRTTDNRRNDHERHGCQFKHGGRERREQQRDAEYTVQAQPTPPPPSNCHPSYVGVCIPPPPPDLDCSQIPYRNFQVIYTVPNPDPHRFDGDRDGIGCES